MSSTALQQFWSGLRLELALVPASIADCPRIAHLAAQSGAFNLGPDDRDEAAFAALLSNGDNEFQLVRVKDRYDDYGIAGVVGWTVTGSAVEVDTLVLNCRVLGKGVEQQLLEEIVRMAEQRGCSEVKVRYHRTARNA